MVEVVDEVVTGRTVALGRGDAFGALAHAVTPRAETLHACADAQELLRRLRETVADLVLLHLPDTGADPAALVRIVADAAPDVPVVVLGARIDESTVAPLLAAGAAACLATGDTPRADLARAIACVRARGVRLRDANKKLQALASRLHACDEWQRRTTRALAELVHDLRTPLCVVAGFGANLLDGLHGPLSDTQRHALERMVPATQLMASLLERTDEVIPRPPATTTGPLPAIRTPSRRQLYLVELCEDVIALFEPQAREKDIALAFTHTACPPVWGERARLTQLLVNLLSNAFRFAPPGGRVEVSLAPEDLRDDGGATACRLVVRDSGPGIAPGAQSAIFDAGYTTGADAGHAGMGLAICMQVAREHHATLGVQSRPGAGAAFHLVLPVDPRRRRPSVKVNVIHDRVLAGQLLLTLRRLHGAPLRVERPADVEALADAVLAAGGHLVVMDVAGEPDGVTRSLDAVQAAP